MVEEDTRIWESPKKPQEIYPFRVDIEPDLILDEADWIEARPFHERMTWTQKWPAKNWTLAYQGNLREVPEEDFELILEELRAAQGAVKS